MSAPRKKLSGAQYRKRAKERAELEKQIAAKKKKELQQIYAPSDPLASSNDTEILEDVNMFCSLIYQDEDSSSISKHPSQQSIDLREQSSSLTTTEELEDVKLGYKESPHIDGQKENENLDTLDLSDPSNWPLTEKMTDEQRSFISSQVVLLAEKYPEILDFSSTERYGRHLTSFMWYRTMANNEKIKRSWLIYSKTKNAIFCAPCKIYHQKISAAAASALCTTGFINWKHALDRLAEHEASQVHRECMIKWKIQVHQIKSCQGIHHDIERLIHMEKVKWRQILRIVIDAVLYLSTNCLSIHGPDEIPSQITENPLPSQGNFLNLFFLLAKHNLTLKYQLDHLKNGQVYLSKTIQNEIIDIMANTVQNSILKDIKEAKYYTIMLDCTPDDLDVSHTEQISEVIRYVKKSSNVCEIKESFIDFIEIGGKTIEYIVQQIVEKLTLSGLDIGQCRGLSYDNSSNMSPTYKGVHAKIKEMSELVEFVPCLAHSLNLVGMNAVSSCPETVSLFGIVQKIFNFFVGYPTRWDIMKKCTKTNLKGNSQTRWPAKYEAVQALLNNLPEVVKTLEQIEEISSNALSKYEAGHLVCSVKNFQFIIMLTIWANILREINRVNIEIQKEDIIFERSVTLMDGLTKTLQKLRENPIEYWIGEAKIIAEKIEVDPILINKGILNCIKEFDELREDESQTPQTIQLFSKAINIIFDRIISKMKTRSDSASRLNSNFVFLNGFEILNMSTKELQKKASDLTQKYERDLNAFEFRQELAVFKEQAPFLFGDLKKASAFYILQQIYRHDLQDAFPNICIALRMYSTLPTTSASCERNLSKLKLIKNYLRSSMSRERLSSLAILAIENQSAHQINYDEAIDLFVDQKVRSVKF